MSTQKTTKEPVEMESALWVYDTLMAVIEPELTSKNLPHVDEMHAGESPDDRAARYERYTLAFSILQECLLDLDYDIRARTQAVKAVEFDSNVRKANAVDRIELQALENQMNTSPSVDAAA